MFGIYAPLGLSGLSGTFFDFPPWKSCWDGVMFQNNFSLRVKMCGVFRKHDDYKFAAQRWKSRRTGRLLLCESDFRGPQPPVLGTCRKHMQPEPIINCVAASSSNTPGRHCWKMQQLKHKTNRNVQADDLDRICTSNMWLLYALQAKSASIDVTKGEGEVSL